VHFDNWDEEQPIELLAQILAGKSPGTACDVPPFNLDIFVERRRPSDPL
jgi:hypothetical protein